MVGATVYNLTAVSTSNVQLVTSEQLKPLASRIFDKIISTPGYPLDWGVARADLKPSVSDFGLAKAGSTDSSYELDWYKVQWLIKKLLNKSDNPLFLDETDFGKLMGLYENDHWNYGYRLVIKPALNITTNANINIDTREKTVSGSINVIVRMHDGRPAANADVNVMYLIFYLTTTDEFGIIPGFYLTKTDKDGKTPTYSFSERYTKDLQGEPVVFVLTTASYYGIKGVGDVFAYFKESGKGIDANITENGNKLIITYSDANNPPSSRHMSKLLGAIAIDLSTLIYGYRSDNPGFSGYVVTHGVGKYYQTYDINPPISDDVIFLFLPYTMTEPGKGRTLYIAGLVRGITPSQSVIYGFGGEISGATGGIETASFKRYVTMNGLTYIAELTVWRMAE